MRNLPGLAWIKDRQGRYVYVNQAAARAFRHDVQAILGRSDRDLFPVSTAAQFRENDERALLDPSGVQVVETLRHEDGLVHHSIVSKFAIPGRSGDVMVGGMAIDITEQRNAEETLRDSEERLRLALDALREADRRKDEFLALLGHELRNPLAPISNAVHILKLPGADEATHTRCREMIERQVEHLVRLVDDLLDVSRIMRGKIELRRETVELANVVARAVETSQSILDAEGHALKVSLASEPVWVSGDLIRLAQVVSNLLHNAAKFTDRGGTISLSAASEDGEAVLRVRDTGVGVTPENRTRIFDMFFQAERGAEGARGGLGIGLSVVRGLVELHGGTVEVVSEGAGRGSEFIVRLPGLAPEPKHGTPRGTEIAGGRAWPRRRVLVVDDNADAADSLALLLRLEGQEVLVAYDAVSAFAMAVEKPPAVAFVDLGIPDVDGYELARRFRSEPALRGVRLVALTGGGQEEDRRRTSEAGFERHLVKPVSPEVLREIVETMAATETN